MARPRVRMSARGSRAVLTSPELQAHLKGITDRIAADANAQMGEPGPTDVYGFRSTQVANPRVRATARATTGGYTSRRHNAKFNTLLKALGGLK